MLSVAQHGHGQSSDFRFQIDATPRTIADDLLVLDRLDVREAGPTVVVKDGAGGVLDGVDVDGLGVKINGNIPLLCLESRVALLLELLGLCNRVLLSKHRCVCVFRKGGPGGSAQGQGKPAGAGGVGRRERD